MTFLIGEAVDAGEDWCFTISGGVTNADEIGEDSSFTLMTKTAEGVTIDTVSKNVTGYPGLTN